MEYESIESDIKKHGGCNSCPRACGVDREKHTGFCMAGRLPAVAKAFLHPWEEPCISGERGSGTVFLSGCNLRCIFCQNHEISHQRAGKEISIGELAEIFLMLQQKGAHNINIVNPSHYTDILVDAIKTARTQGLSVPIVYNSNGYDKIESLLKLEGLVQIYLPDFKYFSNELAKKYSQAENYLETVTEALMEMYRQVGGPVLDERGVMKKGLMIRHLVMPKMTGQSIKILDWIKANLPGDIYISIMSQYFPCYKACETPEIDRRITRREYERVVDHMEKLEFEYGYIQERDSACEQYVPKFDLEGVE